MIPRPEIFAEDADLFSRIPTSPGLLAVIGRILDWPGRKVRELISGKEEATGRDVLQKLGLQDYGNQGVGGGIAGFLTELATDPLMYLGGIGTLTKAGKAAAKLEKLQKLQKAAETVAPTIHRLSVEPAARIAELLAEGAEPLAKGWKAQGLAGQRSLLKVGVPFTPWEKTLVTAPGALGGLESLGAGIRGSWLGQKYLKHLVPSEKLAETAERYQTAEVRKLVEKNKALDKAAKLKERLSAFYPKEPEALDPFREKLATAYESLGTPEEMLAKQAEVQERGTQRLAKVNEIFRQKFGRLIGEYGPSRRNVAFGMKDVIQPYTEAQHNRLMEILGRVQGKTAKEVERLKGLEEAARANIAAVPEETLPILGEFKDWMGKQRGEELLAGVKSPELESDVWNYFGRTPGPGMEYLRKQFPQEFSRRYGMRENPVIGAYSMKREKPLRNLSTVEAGKAIAEEWGPLLSKEQKAELKNLPIFELGLPEMAVRRVVAGQKNITSANLAKSLLEDKDLMAPMEHPEVLPGYKPGEVHRLMPRAEFYEKSGLKVDPVIKAEYEASGLGIRRDVANEFLHVQEVASQPEVVGKFTKAWDKVSSLLRLSVTGLFPAYHVRNIFSDVSKSWVSGNLDLGKVLQAWRESGDPKALRRYSELGALMGTRGAEMEQGLRLSYEAPGVMEKVATSPLGEAVGRRYFHRSENFTRILHFLGAKAKGMTDLEAADSVRRWLLDYTRLTPSEQKLRRYLFFYLWNARTIQQLPGMATMFPSKMAGLARLTTQPTSHDWIPGTMETGTPLPEFIRQSAAIPLAGGQYLTGFGSPLEALSKLDWTSPEGLGLGTAKAAFRKLGAELNPMVRAPLEMATGREFFYDRPILAGDKAPPILEKIPGLREAFGATKEVLPGGGVRYRADPMMLFLLRASPFSRLLQTASQLGNVVAPSGERTKSPGLALLQALTGVRAPNVDEMDRLRSEIEAMKGAMQPLQREGKIGIMEEPFARTVEGMKAPEAVELLKQYRQTRKRLGQMRETGELPAGIKRPKMFMQAPP